MTSPFTDTAGNVHAFAIDCAATYGITTGATPTTYGPGRIVTRGQMASFLHEVLVAGEVPTSAADQGYTDVGGNIHEVAINAISSAGVASGTSATTFSPERTDDASADGIVPAQHADGVGRVLVDRTGCLRRRRRERARVGD